MTSQISFCVLAILYSHCIVILKVGEITFSPRYPSNFFSFLRGLTTTKVRRAKGKVSLQGICQDILFWFGLLFGWFGFFTVR